MSTGDTGMSGDEASERLGRALAALPAADPPAETWARIEARLTPRAPARAWLAPAAAAAFAVVLAVGLWLRPGADRTLPASAFAPDPPATAHWQDRSAALERVLERLPEPRLTRASTGFTTAMLEDRIALVDARLSDDGAAPRDPALETALWRERVLLLDSLVHVRYAAALDAAP